LPTAGSKEYTIGPIDTAKCHAFTFTTPYDNTARVGLGYLEKGMGFRSMSNSLGIQSA